jgi:hypothetical protein
MRLRLTKVDEYQFLTCFKHSLWGSKVSRFKEWQEGDCLAFIVNRELAGYAVVSSKPFREAKIIWGNGLFPYRISIKFMHVLAKEQRPPILGEVRDILTSAWGPKYGWGILTQQVLEGNKAETIVRAITSRQDNLRQVEADISPLLAEAKQERELLSKQAPSRRLARVVVSEEKIPLQPIEGFESKEEESLHSQGESALVKLGKITGCSVFIASNDRNRIFRGKALGEDCLRDLPNLGLNEEAVRRISLIDVIWLTKNSPVCAFEVEATTSIYSGLLRMSDLLSVVPSLKISLYIVAPKNRQDRVRAELTRPTFQKIGLSEYCKFIPMEDLQHLLSRLEGLEGHVQPSIVDKVAVGFGEETEGLH